LKNEVLHRVKEERNFLQTVKLGRLPGLVTSYVWNCLLQHVIEGKIEGRIGMTGRRRKQLLDDLKERRGY